MTLATMETEIPGAPDGIHVEPKSVDEVVEVLRHATEHGIPVRVWGGGTRQKMGVAPPEGLVMSTAGLAAVEVWEPDDLTMVVGAGKAVGQLEGELEESRQTAVLPENSPNSTVGGVIATGWAPLRRARMLGLRERVLEITSVTGDGRVVRSGGRVVKNVSGYDLHKASVGAFGSLGVVVSVCLKLWPVPPVTATFTMRDPDQSYRLNRPLALLETEDELRLFSWGTQAEIDDLASWVDGDFVTGHRWPEDPGGEFRWSLRVPPALTTDAIDKGRPWPFLAIHGAGEVRFASESLDGAVELRSWAHSVGGSLVLIDHPGETPSIDPWGAEPPAVDLQRRLIGEFDPARIINPGRLPGDL